MTTIYTEIEAIERHHDALAAALGHPTARVPGRKHHAPASAQHADPNPFH